MPKQYVVYSISIKHALMYLHMFLIFIWEIRILYVLHIMHNNCKTSNSRIKYPFDANIPNHFVLWAYCLFRWIVILINQEAFTMTMKNWISTYSFRANNDDSCLSIQAGKYSIKFNQNCVLWQSAIKRFRQSDIIITAQYCASWSKKRQTKQSELSQNCKRFLT